MAFVKGMKRPEGAGMPKGHVTVRHRDTAEMFEKIVKKFGDPMEELAKIAFDSSVDLPLRQNSLKELGKYGYAQRKAVELSGPNGDPVQLDVKIFDNALDMLKTAARNKTPEK